MGSQNTQPDADPAQTGAESTDIDSTQNQSDSPPDNLPLSRRGALASVAGLVGLSILSGSAQARHGGQHWRNDIDAEGNTLFNLGTLEMRNNPAFGTTDNTALEGVVDSERFLRISPTATEEAPNVVVGHGDNSVTGDITGATISGGGTAEDQNTAVNPNTVGGNYGTVGGGLANSADGAVATVAGGSGNEAGGRFAFIGGGTSNEATEDQSTVAGGNGNVVSDVAATIAGGSKNVIDGGSSIAGFSTIAGGKQNVASGPSSTIGGGWRNQVHARFATIAGGGPFDPFIEGTSNVVYDQYGAIGGGGGNQAGSDDGDTNSAEFATVAGGDRNTASGRGSTIGGGRRNSVGGRNGTISGGGNNNALGILSTIGGGRGNTAEGEEATVAGGAANSAIGELVSVGGGTGNTAEGWLATVGGGKGNEAKGDFATIGGGGPSVLVSPDDTKNVVYDRHGTIGGGGGNRAGSAADESQEGFSTVAGGRDNTASAYAATVGGGQRNTAASSESTVAGGEDNTINDVAGSATIGGGEENTANGRLSTIGGGEHNETRALYATIGGGGPSEPVFPDDSKNVVYDDYGTVGGGGGNQAGSDDDDTTTATFATVGGGADNTASQQHATIGGGSENEAHAKYATIAGGGPSQPFQRAPTNNVVYDEYGTIGGGGNNQVGTNDEDPTSAAFATVSGGEGNTASGQAATVPGGTNGNAVNDHSFVWNDGSLYHDTDGDSIDDGLSSAKNVGGFSAPPTGDNTFHVSATGGFRFITGSSHSPNVTYIPGDSAGWTTASTRTAKTNIDPVDPKAVLSDVEEMEVATWEYKDGDGAGQGVRHIGPMAEDFHAAVEVGDSDEHINSINADGLAFAAIQGLAEKLDEKDVQLTEQADQIDDLEAENEALREGTERLQERLDAVEDRLASVEAGQSFPVTADD